MGYGPKDLSPLGALGAAQPAQAPNQQQRDHTRAEPVRLGTLWRPVRLMPGMLGPMPRQPVLQGT